MKRFTFHLAAMLMAAASLGARQDVPPELKALAEKARVGGSLAAWCRAEFIPGRTGAFAVAVKDGADGGRYLAVQPDGGSAVLGSFRSGADLACYTRAQARELDTSIKRSETIQGSIQPRWNTTVVCGFVDDTSAVCWQYSSTLRRYVQVGQWTT